jgi:hypothetical protein
MSQPNISATEYRKRYLATLKMQSLGNAKNLEANKLFKATGQPAPLTDTRTITEKTADAEVSKQVLVKDLLSITDSGNAQQIATQLTQEERAFLIQQYAPIEREIKARFRGGVPAEAFMAYLRRYITKYRETLGVEPTLEQASQAISVPVTELVQQIKEERGKKKGLGNPEGDGTFEVADENLEPIDVLSAKDLELRKWFGKLKKELALQIKVEENLTPEQVGFRKATLASIKAIGSTSADAYRAWINDNDTAWQRIMQITVGTTGAGLNSHKKRKSIVGKGIGASPVLTRYTGFGKYILDNPALENNILQLKSKAQVPVPHLASRRISDAVKNVVKKISGGTIPNYSDIEGLTADERSYLNNVGQKSQLPEQFVTPKDKNAEQKEQDRFDILRGQILAGNDNSSLVKEFKFMLLKFANTGRVPKQEAQDILMDLASVGL